MKLLCATIVSLLGVSSGNVLQTFSNGVSFTPYSNAVVNVPLGTVNNVQITNSVPYDTYEAPCLSYVTDQILADFRVRIFKFITGSFRKAVVLSGGHMAYSPYTAWLTMSAIAEGTEGSARAELFRVLSLPEDRCLRQIFYKLATSREFPSNDVVLGRRRQFITDPSVYINKNWEEFARWYTNLKTVLVPFKRNNTELENLKRIFKVKLPNVDPQAGNSLLLESLDYFGLWSSAFADARIEVGPFYNFNEEEIGDVEFMKITKQVNIAYVPSAKLKVIEIPVGRDGRYKMFIAMTLEKDPLKAFEGYQDDLVFEVLANMKPSPGPIKIEIPRLAMTSEVDVRNIFEEMGARSVWQDPLATRNISNPAALPVTFTQRVSISLDNNVVDPPVQDLSTPWTAGVLTRYADNVDELKDFIANRQFLIAVFDVETYTSLFVAAYSKPGV